MKNLKKFLPHLIYLSLVIATGLVPNYGALDRIATQWLYLSVINTLGLLHFLFIGNTQKTIKSFLNFKPFIFLILFTFWGLLSFFYATNSVEVLVKFVRWIQLPITLFILSTIYFSYKDTNYFVKTISVLITLVLLIELYFSYSPYFQLIEYAKYDFSFANILKGATANKNITAASILIKTPFVLYLIFNLKNRVIQLLLSIINYSAYYLVFLLSARSAIIAFLTVFILLLVSFLINILRDKSVIKNAALWMVTSSLVFSVVFFQFNFRDNNSASFVKRVSTINTEDESTNQRLRFYKHSIDQIISHPIIGVGLGNWKINSIDYDKEDVKGYTVPYHTHNDFLEIGAELGIIGLLLYLLIFYYPIKGVIKNFNLKETDVNILILTAGIIYFVDANLNFPHARPVMQIPFILILVIAFVQQNNLKDDNI